MEDFMELVAADWRNLSEEEKYAEWSEGVTDHGLNTPYEVYAGLYDRVFGV